MILLRIYMNITAVRTLPASGAEFHCLLLLTGGRFSLSNLCVSLPLSHTHTHRRLQPGSRKKKKKQTAADKNKEANAVGTELELLYCCKVKADQATAQ